MNRKITLALLVFAMGYICNDIIRELNLSLIKNVYAEVAGMGYYDLKSDYDFKKAVKYIVEQCSVTGGYVDADYIYDMSLSC